MLREHGEVAAVNIGLISQQCATRLTTSNGVVLEGILYAAHYSEMLRALREDHLGRTFHYFLDVSFAETVLRDATRPQSNEFGVDAMRKWYHERDLPPFVQETRIPETSPLDETLERILIDAQSTTNSVIEQDVAHRAALY